MPKLTTREREIRFKVSEDKFEMIKKHAERHDESVSAFARHIVMEKVNTLEALFAQTVASDMFQFMKQIEDNAKNRKD